MTPKSEGAKPKRKPRRGAPIVVTPLWSGGQCHIAGLVTISESNRRGHWRKHSDRTKNQRMVARSCTERIKVNFMPVALPAHFELTRIAPRALDDDNLRGALKAIRDGIADAMGCKDNDPRISFSYGQERRRVREYGVLIRALLAPAEKEKATL
jgi:hypothetical protein